MEHSFTLTILNTSLFAIVPRILNAARYISFLATDRRCELELKDCCPGDGLIRHISGYTSVILSVVD
jgi:hypothetical protein